MALANASASRAMALIVPTPVMTTRTFCIDLEEPLKGRFRFSDNKTTAIDKTLNRYNKIVMHINVRMELTIGPVGVKAITGLSDPSPPRAKHSSCPATLPKKIDPYFYLGSML